MPNERSGPSTPPVVCVVRLWLPDRPGALGQVASRIGSVRGDVVGIDILERGGGRAIDELTVELPDAGLVDLLVTEIAQVDGVAVEDVRLVDGQRPDAGSASLEIAAALTEAVTPERLEVLCARVVTVFEADWTVVLGAGLDESAVVAGACPDPVWLSAFLAGSRHLDREAQVAGAPGELAWACVGEAAVLAVGRSSRPFHAREREQIELLGRITAALLAASLVG